MTISSIPLHFTIPLHIEGHKTNYLAVPTRQFLHRNQPVTSYQLRRCDSSGVLIPRVRQSKKARLTVRRSAQ